MTDTSVYLYRSGNGAYGFTGNKDGTGLSDEMDPWSFITEISPARWETLGLAKESDLAQVAAGTPYIIDDPDRIEELSRQFAV